MIILFIADIIGKPGLDIVASLLPGLIQQTKADLVIANGENGAEDGRGLTPEIANIYENFGIDVITSGNHIFDKSVIRKYLNIKDNILRPLNFPQGSGGHGSVIVKTRNGEDVAVINLQGRTYMSPLDCPFRTLDKELKNHIGEVKVKIVDFHAESTGEKQALAWYFDGRVSAVIGTHTHIQTADERILPKGTGYITDAGMTGPFESVIGLSINNAINRFILQTPHPNIIAKNDLHLNGILLDIDSNTGCCLKIQRLQLP